MVYFQNVENQRTPLCGFFPWCQALTAAKIAAELHRIALREFWQGDTGVYQVRIHVAQLNHGDTMTLPSFIQTSPALQTPGLPAGFDYGRALSLREMARHYTEMPKYLLAPEVTALLHYLPDWNQHAFINTQWNTGARLNEALALKGRIHVQSLPRFKF